MLSLPTYGQGHCGSQQRHCVPAGRADFPTPGISLLQRASNVFSGAHIQASLSTWLLLLMVL